MSEVHVVGYTAVVVTLAGSWTGNESNGTVVPNRKHTSALTPTDRCFVDDVLVQFPHNNSCCVSECTRRQMHFWNDFLSDLTVQDRKCPDPQNTDPNY